MYVFVAATARSIPAPSVSTSSAACASSEAGSLVIATVNAPCLARTRDVLDHVTASGRTGRGAITVEPDMSSSAL